MASETSPHLARTIEFQTALVHLKGEWAGTIEVPIFVGPSRDLDGELNELALQVEGEPRLLRPVRQEFFAGQLRLIYFSHLVRVTRSLPSTLQLHLGESDQEKSCGMELLFRAASLENTGKE